MWARRRGPAATLAAVLIGLVAASCRPPEPKLAGLEPAPDFQGKLLGGRSLSLAGLKGKVVLLDFWATWCGPCEDTIPHLVGLYGRRQARGLEVVGVSVDDDDRGVPDYVKAHRMPYPIFVDADKTVMDLYGVRNIPTTVLVDRAGRIRARWLGAGADIERDIDAAIDKLLDEHTL